MKTQHKIFAFHPSHSFIFSKSAVYFTSSTAPLTSLLSLSFRQFQCSLALFGNCPVLLETTWSLPLGDITNPSSVYHFTWIWLVAFLTTYLLQLFQFSQLFSIPVKRKPVSSLLPHCWFSCWSGHSEIHIALNPFQSFSFLNVLLYVMELCLTWQESSAVMLISDLSHASSSFSKQCLSEVSLPLSPTEILFFGPWFYYYFSGWPQMLP